VLDWDDLRFFLALTRHGSLSAAAKSLHVAQSTVGRRLSSLEASLGARLLNRTPEGYVATLAGEELRKTAERLETEILTVERDVSGRDTQLAGVVRVTSAETVAAHIMAPSFAELRTRHPDITIELIPNSRELSLSMREADISVRLRLPDQHDLIVRRIGSVAFGLYASQDYLDAHGDLHAEDGCPGHDIITQLDDDQEMTQTEWLTELASRSRVAMQTSSHEAALLAAANGGGLACLACFRANREPRLIRLVTTDPPPSADIWLIVHKDNRDNPRIRITLTHITDCIRRLHGELEPEPEAIGGATGS
jgi:DNA-binding transcriptional LysR family regulator